MDQVSQAMIVAQYNNPSPYNSVILPIFENSTTSKEEPILTNRMFRWIPGFDLLNRMFRWISNSIFTSSVSLPHTNPQNKIKDYKVKNNKYKSIKHEEYYMQHKNRGKCIIFNHEEFKRCKLEPRINTDMDATRIQQTFTNLGFTVEICNDYTRDRIYQKIEKLSKEDHTDNDCICFFILSHGEDDDIIWAQDKIYYVDDLLKHFTTENCSTLAGKPKLFFFQVCRGNKLDRGVKMPPSKFSQTDGVRSTPPSAIPIHADLLIAHSTVQGFKSWRNPETGSWFIQSLCDILDEYATTTDLLKMLTLTSRKVATQFTSDHEDPSMHDNVQVPSVTTMLTRDLYFLPKNL